MKTIETKMPFCKSVSRWARLWMLAFGILLAAHAWLAPAVRAQWENYEPYTFTTLAGSVGSGILDGIGGAARSGCSPIPNLQTASAAPDFQ